MPSFEEIMRMPASDIKPPEAYPVGTYHCLVDGPPEKGKSSKKETDFLEFKLKILRPMEDVNGEAAAAQQVVGKTLRHQIYITDGSAYRLIDFLCDHLGIEKAGKSPSELVAEAPGKQVLVKVKHEPSQDGTRVFHRVESTAKV